MSHLTDHRTIRRLKHLVKERIALLRLLDAVPIGVRLGLTAAMLVASILPAAIAVAVAWLVGRVGAMLEPNDATNTAAALSPVAIPLAVVGVLLVVDQVSQSLLGPLRDWVATLVNGKVRSRVRQAVSVRPGVEHLELQVVRDAAALPVENTHLFNLGAGAEGQLWLMSRFVGAIVAASLVARSSVLAAVAALGFTAWQRSLLRRHYAGAIASGLVDTTADGRAASYWSEVLGTEQGAKEVRLFGFGDWALARFHRHARRPVDELSKVLLGAQRLHWQVFALNGLAALVPFLLLGRLAIEGALSRAELTAAIGGVVAVARVLGPMGYEAFSIEAAVPQLAALDRLAEFSDEEARRTAGPPTTGSPTIAPSVAGTPGVPEIVFEQVSFAYPGTDLQILDRLELTLEPGRSVAIVGENGAGKTTLLKLLSGFYRPDSGRILIDGTDLDAIDPVEWRRRLAVIFQDFTHFELSAFDNIALADPDRPDSRELVAAAAVAAGADAIVDGLALHADTMLSRAYTDGVDLSGGQWQRIALARAMYAAMSGGQVVILDEPTASLDVDAEVALFDQLLTHAAGRTAVVVSHRYSTVRRADRIVVLADGRVAEDGSHDELIARCGRYATLYDLQATKFRDDPDSESDGADPDRSAS